MTKEKEAARLEALSYLKEYYKPGDTVYTMLRHVSSNGMSRRISVIVDIDGKPRNISKLVAWAIGMRFNDEGSIVTGGVGMDMGYAICHALSRTLFPDSFDCIGDKCPANDHFNGDKDYTPHRHSDGGYALRHAWI